MKIVKKRMIPMLVLLYEVIQYRLPESHKKFNTIKIDYLKEKSGYYGERELDYYLNMIESNNYYYFQGIRLKLHDKYFQIDSLVICPSFFLILEVKNWGGILKFDSVANQVIQNNNGNTTKFQDPTLQAHRHKLQLEEWLKRNNFKYPPIEKLVVMANPDALIDFDTQNESTKKIIYPDYAIEKIAELEKNYQTQVLTKRDINSITKQILEKDTPKVIDILKTYNLSSKEIIPGVQCLNCKRIPMIKKYKTWYCPTCKIHSTRAHEKTILDYLLIHSSMTNKQCREFLGLPPSSSRRVSKYLKKMNLPSSGTTSNRIYFLPHDYSFTKPRSNDTTNNAVNSKGKRQKSKDEK